MEVKGVLNVSRRVNQGLKKVDLNDDYLLTSLAHAWHSLDPDGADRIVSLPDATTLQEGWSVVVHHNGSDNLLTVQDQATEPNELKVISAPAGYNDTKAYQFVLIDNETAGGQWKVIELGDPTVKADKHEQVFAKIDWIDGLNDLFTYTIPETIHTMGLNPNWQVFDESNNIVYCHEETVNRVDGTITLTVTADDEFDGSVVIW